MLRLAIKQLEEGRSVRLARWRLCPAVRASAWCETKSHALDTLLHGEPNMTQRLWASSQIVQQTMCAMVQQRTAGAHIAVRQQLLLFRRNAHKECSLKAVIAPKMIYSAMPIPEETLEQTIERIRDLPPELIDEILEIHIQLKKIEEAELNLYAAIYRH